MILLVGFARKRWLLFDRKDGTGADWTQRLLAATIDDMIAAGELEETSFCWHWTKPTSPAFEKS